MWPCFHRHEHEVNAMLIVGKDNKKEQMIEKYRLGVPRNLKGAVVDTCLGHTSLFFNAN